jgi:hypothetical protein
VGGARSRKSIVRVWIIQLGCMLVAKGGGGGRGRGGQSRKSIVRVWIKPQATRLAAWAGSRGSQCSFLLIVRFQLQQRGVGKAGSEIPSNQTARHLEC